MVWSAFLALALFLATGNAERVKRERITDNGDDLLKCTDEPIEFAIGIDSSRSISQKEFKLAKDFILNLIHRYDIGDGAEATRAAVFTYGTQVYTQDAFGLDSYLDAHDLWRAVNKTKHKLSRHTNTAKAIDYIHNTVLAKDKVRPNSEKVGIIITDGSSQNHTLTKIAADAARADGIILLAIGVGEESAVSNEELLSVTGNQSLVLRVSSYSDLVSIRNLVQMLYHQSCVTIPKPTQPPCGIVNPTNLFFVFSPVDLNYNVSWINRFMRHVLESSDFSVGFKVGVMDCPVDTGSYGNLTEVPTLLEAIKGYEKDLKNKVIVCPEDGGDNRTENDGRFHLPDILQRVIDEHFSLYASHLRSVVVIFSDYRPHLKEYIDAQVETLVKEDADQVFIALTSDSTRSVNSYYDFQLKGTTPEQQADHFIADMCPKGFIIGDP